MARIRIRAGSGIDRVVLNHIVDDYEGVLHPLQMRPGRSAPVQIRNRPRVALLLALENWFAFFQKRAGAFSHVLRRKQTRE